MVAYWGASTELSSDQLEIRDEPIFSLPYVVLVSAGNASGQAFILVINFVFFIDTLTSTSLVECYELLSASCINRAVT